MSAAAKAFSSGYDAQVYDQAKVYDALVKNYTADPANTTKPVDYALFVDGGVNPRKSGDDRKSGTRIAAPDQTLLAVFRSDANGCSVALCQRRQPPKAGAVGQRLQRVAGQSSWTIKNDGWFRIAQVRLTRERPYAKTVRFSKRTHRRLRADSRGRQHLCR